MASDVELYITKLNVYGLVPPSIGKPISTESPIFRDAGDGVGVPTVIAGLLVNVVEFSEFACTGVLAESMTMTLAR